MHYLNFFMMISVTQSTTIRTFKSAVSLGTSVMMPTILVILAPYTSEQAVASHTSDSDDHTLIFSPSQKSQTLTLAHHKIVEYLLNYGLYKGE